MMNVYVNRFGEQVETVTTRTLLDSWPGTRQAGEGCRARTRTFP
jgi:hypothetical protein